MFTPLQTICLLVTVVYGNSDNCCYPDQFESKVDMLLIDVDENGKQIFITAYCAWSFDASGKRAYLDGVFNYNGNVTVRAVILQLYEERLQYVVENSSTCSTSKLFRWDKNNCIPDAATRLNQYRLGMNPNTVMQDYGLGSVIKYTVTHDECVPVFQQLAGEMLIGTVKFENVTKGIKNPDVFEIPKICEGMKPTDSKIPWRIMFPF